MFYPQYFIDDLKNRADLIRIIQPYAQDLKKKGANWMACCPFHQEKTPSFSVNPAKGFYKCFGCGKGGTAFNFVMEMEGLNFTEAIKRVAEISGVMLPEPVDNASYESGKKERNEAKKIGEQIIELNAAAVDFWAKEFQGRTAKAKAARQYLEQRGVSPETVSTFKIGFAPDKWDALLKFLTGQGYPEEMIRASGLVSVNEEKDRIFDRFRGRIMFPVLDASGRPVAFGARAMGDDQPKYLNSPESPAYIKGRHLYGLFQARESIRKKGFAILVEGYLDLIALHQFGVTNVVASLGTAFTEDQARLLGRTTKQVVVNYDGDSAGVKAARKAIEQLLRSDIDVKILVLPNGNDPDDFIRANGTEAYNKARGNAVSFLPFSLEAASAGRNLHNARQKAAAIEEFLPLISAIGNSIQRRESFDQAMAYFHVDDAGLRRELWTGIRSGRQNAPDAVSQKFSRFLSAKVTVVEKRLIELVVQHDEVRREIMPQLELSDYCDLATADVFAAIFEIERAGKKVSTEAMLELIGDDDLLVELLKSVLSEGQNRHSDLAAEAVLNEAEHCVFTLRKMAISNRIIEVSREAAILEAAGDSTRTHHLNVEQLELEKIRRELHLRLIGM